MKSNGFFFLHREYFNFRIITPNYNNLLKKCLQQFNNWRKNASDATDTHILRFNILKKLERIKCE